MSAKKTGEAFTKPEPEITPRMNLRRWLDKGNARVVKYVEVYLAAGLEADIREMDAEIARLRGANLGVEQTSENEARLRSMAQQVEDWRAEMNDSRVVFKFRGIDGSEVEAIRAAAPVGEDGKPDQSAMGFALFAKQCLAPEGLTAEDFADLHAALGDGYFDQTIVRTAIAARDGVSIDVPFSFAASEILRTRASSAS